MALEYTPVALPYAAAFVINLVLFTALWRHRDRRGAKGFLIDVFALTLLTATVTLQLLSTSESAKGAWVQSIVPPTSIPTSRSPSNTALSRALASRSSIFPVSGPPLRYHSMEVPVPP